MVLPSKDTKGCEKRVWDAEAELVTGPSQSSDMEGTEQGSGWINQFAFRPWVRVRYFCFQRFSRRMSSSMVADEETISRMLT